MSSANPVGEQCTARPEEVGEGLKWGYVGEFELQEVVTAQGVRLKECHASPFHHPALDSSVPVPTYPALTSACAQGHFLHVATRSPHSSPAQGRVSVTISLSYGLSHSHQHKT